MCAVTDIYLFFLLPVYNLNFSVKTFWFEVSEVRCLFWHYLVFIVICLMLLCVNVEQQDDLWIFNYF